jgi:hypothetical protein
MMMTTAGSVSVQVQDPDGTTSNGVTLIVAPPNLSDEVIALTSGAPTATAQDIVVVDPTTAGVSLPEDDVDLNLEALGPFSTASNTCTPGGNPLALQRPANGTANADICMFSESGLDTSMTFTVSGPADITVIAKQPLGLGIVRMTLQISASTLPGHRTLFVQNTNLDKAAASGAPPQSGSRSIAHPFPIDFPMRYSGAWQLLLIVARGPESAGAPAWSRLSVPRSAPAPPVLPGKQSTESAVAAHNRSHTGWTRWALAFAC